MEQKEKIYSVSELTRELKFLLEGTFMRVWIEGEVSGFSRPSSGHLYFNLKDQNAIIACVMFKGYLHKSTDPGIADGKKILVFGKITVYEPKGQYQIVVEKIRLSGRGELLEQFEKLKQKLASEGLFDEKHKRPIPFLPSQIGIITSPTGAAIHDMIRIIFERFPARILIYPSAVQGADAPKELISGIKALNSIQDVDVIIIGRGGGSFEDLFCFNDENLVRAVYSSEKPIISAVGHEIDFNLTDFAADRRAPTPSAAAEMVVPEMSDLISRLNEKSERIIKMIRSEIDARTTELYQRGDDIDNALKTRLNKEIISLEQKKQKLFLLHPKNRLANNKDRLVFIKKEIYRLIEKNLNKNKYLFEILKDKLEVLSPLSCLSRGYSITRKLPERVIIRSSESLAEKDKIEILLGKGKVKGIVEKID